MPHPPRPTVRCLLEDLAGTVTEKDQRSALLSGSLPGPEVPLHEIAHPMVESARARYTGDTPPARDELIRKVRDQRWAKCRHGERWRGIVWWHETEQRWLCYAGWREDGATDDAYTYFETTCASGSTHGSTAFLATDDDRLRLTGEHRVANLAAAEQQFQVSVLIAAVAAVTDLASVHEVLLPSGSTLSVWVDSLEGAAGTHAVGPVGKVDDDDREVEPGSHLDGDWMGDLCLRVTVDWSSDTSSIDEVDRAMAAVPGIAGDEWTLVSHTAADQFPEFWVLVDSDWSQRLLHAVEDHGVASLCENPRVVLDAGDDRAHVATTASVNKGYVNGELVRSVCGRRFVPSIDPDTRDLCEECSDFRAAWARVRQHLGTLSQG